MIILLGPVHPYRGGGITSFNERLMTALQAEGQEVMVYNFKLLYPSFLFPGKSQMADHVVELPFAAPRLIHSCNPLNWIRVGLRLRKAAPDIVLVRYWLPLLGPCLGTILRIAARKRSIRIICIADNVIPHEKRFGDRPFTLYFVGPVERFITMSRQVLEDLRTFTHKPAIQVAHPLYDHFGAKVDKATARGHLGIPAGDRVILFFGFIRKYKGLDLLLEAMGDPRLEGIRLLIAGEFYDDPDYYTPWLSRPEIASRLILKTGFIPDGDIPYYFGASDFIIQPYRSATQSGVTPLAYFYEKAMLVTRVGGLPDLVPDGKAGVVTEPNPQAIADGILALYGQGEAHFRSGLLEEKDKYSWSRLAKSILELARLGPTPKA
jgi:glycosyltransferase involved in cell wall biosynthesis